ncbi:MAG TPA: hypothetical protein VN939_09900 [Chthoniobacterales bacterium]|nr:hypothetical protein [Chthoniobacterales bacterium]
MRTYSDVYYHRNYGSQGVVCLWTFFYRLTLIKWLTDDITIGYRNLLKEALAEEAPLVLYNEAFSRLQQSKLKESRKDTGTNRRMINGFMAVPLIPVVMSEPNCSTMDLPEPLDAAVVKVLLTEMLTAFNWSVCAHQTSRGRYFTLKEHENTITNFVNASSF